MIQPSLVAFDLDDTLYKERDFLRSGHRLLARTIADATGEDADELFRLINGNHPRGIEAALGMLARKGHRLPFTVDGLVEIYRNHTPDIQLSPGVEETLTRLKACGHRLVLITDGSSRHQRSKIVALGLDRFFGPDAILISGETGGDKHTPLPFRLAEERFGAACARRFYVGDNLAKDFVHPNLRGWTSVMLLDTAGVNVFPQDPVAWPAIHRASVALEDLENLPL